MATIPESDMPAPRIQLKWEDLPETQLGVYRWTVVCAYSLVLKLADYDIRGEREGDLPKLKELAIKMGDTMSTGFAAKRYDSRDDTVDTPFRDHSHALWDSEQLGNLPVYAVAAGRAMLVSREKETKGRRG